MPSFEELSNSTSEKGRFAGLVAPDALCPEGRNFHFKPLKPLPELQQHFFS